jgi:transposase
MAVTRARKTEIAQRRKNVAELYVQGWTQMQIADKLQIGQATVCYDLQKLQKEWRESRIRDFDAARELEIQKLDRVEREAWAAWENSKRPSQSAEFKDDATNTPTKKRVKNQNGDPRFLVVVHQCIASRRALLGLDSLPALPKEETEGGQKSSERLVSLITTLRQREREEADRTIVIDQQPGSVCDDGERRQVEDGAAPGLPGPSDHRVD